MREFVGKVFDEVAGFDNIQEIADHIVECHNNREVRDRIMALNKLKSSILELTNGISLSFKNKEIYIDPFTKENINVYYKNEVYNYKNVDDLLEDYIIDGYSLTEIIDEIEFN